MERILISILALLLLCMYCRAVSKCPKMEVDSNNGKLFKFSGSFEDWWFAYTVAETYIKEQTFEGVKKNNEIQFLLMEPGDTEFKVPI